MTLNRLDTLWNRSQSLYVIEEKLPDVGQANVIYLVPSGDDNYESYLYVEGEYKPLGVSGDYSQILNRLTKIEQTLEFIDV